MRQRYEEQSYASSMQSEVVEQGVGHSRRGRAFLQVDRRRTACRPWPNNMSTPRSPVSPSRSPRPSSARASACSTCANAIITGKAKFENLARMYSQDPGTMMRGGEMDPTRRSNGLEAPHSATALEKMTPGPDFGGGRVAASDCHIIQLAGQARPALPFPPHPAAPGLHDGGAQRRRFARYAGQSWRR